MWWVKGARKQGEQTRGRDILSREPLNTFRTTAVGEGSMYLVCVSDSWSLL